MKNENTNIMDIFIFQKIPMKFFFTFCIKHKYLISEEFYKSFILGSLKWEN